MKKILTTTVFLFTALLSQAMSYEQAREKALFLTDKMAYELNLTDEQYEAAYEINLDYLMGVTTADDLYGVYWERRNLDFSYILLDWQYRSYLAASYFYRPLYWDAGYWHFGIYARYPYRDYFYFGRPHFYVTYRGGHSWHHNGGRSWYQHRTFVNNRGGSHFGMHDKFNRGDYGRRGRHGGTQAGHRGGESGHRQGGGTIGNGRVTNGGGNSHGYRGGDTHQNGRVGNDRGGAGKQGPIVAPESSTRQGGSTVGGNRRGRFGNGGGNSTQPSTHLNRGAGNSTVGSGSRQGGSFGTSTRQGGTTGRGTSTIGTRQGGGTHSMGSGTRSGGGSHSFGGTRSGGTTGSRSGGGGHFGGRR